MAQSPRVRAGMRLFTTSVESPDLQGMIKDLEVSATDTTKAVLEFVRKDVYHFLRSYTNVVKPPRYQRKWTLDANQRRIKVPRSDRTGWRPVHPGHWADVSYDLKKKYFTDLRFEDGGWRLYVGNRSDHAVYVEAMDGYFVVHGVLDPNGPVARSIRKALRVLGVDWKVTGALAATQEGPTVGPWAANERASVTSFKVSPRRGKAAPPSGDV